MSFFTTAYFYRPTEPPDITGAQLCAFCEQFAELGIANVAYPQAVQIKFAEGIDQDDRPAYRLRRIANSVYSVEDIDWDIDAFATSPGEADPGLADSDTSIYRAYVTLGFMPPEVCSRFARVRSPENDVDLALDGCSLQLGPIALASLTSDSTFEVGWLAVALAGAGYLYPWRASDLVSRLENDASIQQLMELCRQTWPVVPLPPDEDELAARRAMGDRWPYPRIDRPMDWCWGVSESG
jgi:hypothetical protein